MKIKFQDLSRLHESIKPELTKAFESVLSTSSFIQGSYVQAFEKEFAQYVDMPHCLGVANGTDALEIALRALGVGVGDIVAVPSMTFMATAEAVVSVGAEPLFVDVDANSGCMTADTLQAALLASEKKVKVAIVVHLYGRPCEMEALCNFTKNNGIQLIEDCAQAHGTRINGRHVGAFSDIATFSFYPGKNLGALGDAGAVVTKSKTHYEYMMLLRDHGRKEKYLHRMLGRNSRLDGLQAAFLSAKLLKLDGWVNNRRDLALTYDNGLQGLEQLFVMGQTPQLACHSYHLYVVRVLKGKEQRSQLASFLLSKGIETGVHYPVALHKQPAFGDFLKKSPNVVTLSNSELLMEQVLSLPLDPLMSKEEVNYVCAQIKAWYA